MLLLIFILFGSLMTTITLLKAKYELQHLDNLLTSFTKEPPSGKDVQLHEALFLIAVLIFLLSGIIAAVLIKFL